MTAQRYIETLEDQTRYQLDQAARDLANQPVESVLAMAKDMLSRGMEQEARALVAEWRQLTKQTRN